MLFDIVGQVTLSFIGSGLCIFHFHTLVILKLDLIFLFHIACDWFNFLEFCLCTVIFCNSIPLVLYVHSVHPTFYWGVWTSPNFVICKTLIFRGGYWEGGVTFFKGKLQFLHQKSLVKLAPKQEFKKLYIPIKHIHKSLL